MDNIEMKRNYSPQQGGWGQGFEPLNASHDTSILALIRKLPSNCPSRMAGCEVTMKRSIIPTLVVFFCLQSAAIANSQWWESGSGAEWYEEGEAWKETAVTIPGFPQDDDLLEFSVDNPATRNHTYLLDQKSLSIAEDFVARYSVVIRTQSGATNVFYDGIRCQTGEYKNYAFGVNGNFYPNDSAAWVKIRGADFFRKALLRGILCDEMTDSPKTVEQIIYQIKYNR